MSYILTILLGIVALFIWFFIWGMVLRAKGEKVKWWMWFFDYQVIIVLVGLCFFGYFAIKAFLNSNFFEGNETRKELIEIKKGVDTYKEKSGEYPKTMEELVGKSPVRKDWKTDEWGKAYSLQNSEGALQIVSGGPDGKMHTSDDFKSELSDTLR